MAEQTVMDRTEKARDHSRGSHSEGKMTKSIEQQTAKLPSDFFLWTSVGAMAISAMLEFSGNHNKSEFIGRWAAPLLTIGVYNKLVKLMGSE